MKPRIALFEAFSGMGSLTRALADGLRKHAEVRIAGCVEMEDRYLQHWGDGHPEASTFLGSFSRYHPAEMSMPCAGEHRVFVAGIPCTGTSLAGRSKGGLTSAEEHSRVGHLFLPVAHWIRMHRPDTVIFENVALYPKTLSARCLRSALRAAGYSLFERTLNAYTEFDTPTERIRWVMVATRQSQFAWNPVPQPFSATLEGYLDAPSARDEAESFTAERAAKQSAYCARKTEEGCRFFQRFVDHSSTKCPTICATYGKVQPSATYVKTSKSHRMLRPREVARLHGFPEDFRLPAVKTTAYQVLGQGVCYKPFYALGEALGVHVAVGVEEFALVG